MQSQSVKLQELREQLLMLRKQLEQSERAGKAACIRVSDINKNAQKRKLYLLSEIQQLEQDIAQSRDGKESMTQQLDECNARYETCRKKRNYWILVPSFLFGWPILIYLCIYLPYKHLIRNPRYDVQESEEITQIEAYWEKKKEAMVRRLDEKRSEQIRIDAECSEMIEAAKKEQAEIEMEHKKLLDEIAVIEMQERQVFDKLVEEYSEKAILASAGFRDLVEYTSAIIEELINSSDDYNKSAMCIWEVENVFINYRGFKTIVGKYENAEVERKYFFCEHGKEDLTTLVERCGLAWALMTLVVKELTIRYSSEHFHIWCVRTDNKVEIKCTSINKDYYYRRSFV